MNIEEFVQLDLAPPAVVTRTDEAGEIVVSSAQALQPYPDKVGEWLRRWARERPRQPFLAERRDGSWVSLDYGGVLERVEALAQALLDADLGPTRPLAILSGNSLEHALLQLAALHVGVPVAPVSPAYTLLSRDYLKLAGILELLNPGMVFARNGRAFAPGLAIAAQLGCRLAIAEQLDAFPGAVPFEALEATSPGPEVARRFDRVGPDTLAKILFTSGSTGTPKGVLNTQRMLCSNQQAIRQLWPFLEKRPPVVVDWLPWSHTFGANHNFNLVLCHGGTLYLDEGKPAPGLVEKTIANLEEISPTLYFNVPRGFAMLLPHLETNDRLRSRFFADLDLIFYAGAALPPHLWTRLEEVSVRALGKRVMMVSAWGSTETAPMATAVHFPIDRAGVIGLPAPGTEIKLTPTGSKLALKVRGPNVTPGYWKDEKLTAAAFDSEGFFETGDAGHFLDPDDPARGLVFDGRIAENFKLATGTWVVVHDVRTRVIAAGAPIIQDAVIAGHDREEIGLLIFPDREGCLSLIKQASPSLSKDDPAVLGHPEVREALKARLMQYNRDHPGASRRIGRALILEEPPLIDREEITDKGYLNQRAVLENRPEKVEELYGEPAPGHVLVLGA